MRMKDLLNELQRDLPEALQLLQAMVNMAVAVNLFPVTGQPLPLVSMGGTSIWFTSIAVGMILSVSSETEFERKGGRIAIA